MGRYRFASLNLVLLVLASGQMSLLWGQAPGATPNPPGMASAPAQAKPPEEIADLQTQSRSHLRLLHRNHPLDVYLFAADERMEVLSASYCGGDEGARQYSGHFQLVSVLGNTVVSRFDLDPDDIFVEKKPHDGARLFPDPKANQDLIAVFQFESCNNEVVRFYSADPAGDLFAVPFLDKDGRTWKQKVTETNGVVAQLHDGSSAFCTYADDMGYNFCEAYVFDGANFLETAKWMTQERAEPLKGLDAAGQAKRALFDFLSELFVNDYPAAGYYYAGNLDFPGAPLDVAHPKQIAKILEAYCTNIGGQCLMPTRIESQAGADSQDAVRFQVSFQTGDFQPFQIGDRSSFEFRVAKTAEGFKVLDLPPRLP